MSDLTQDVAKIAAQFSARFKPRTAEQQEAAQKLETEFRQRQHRSLATQCWICANIPPRHSGFKGDINRDPTGKTFALIKSKLGTGFLIALVGQYGNGKTQIAVELLRHRIATTAKPSQFLCVMDFFIRIKKSFKQNSEEAEEDIVREYAHCDLLVIDELDQRMNSDWESLVLFSLINKRYNYKRDTLIVSNRTVADIEPCLGPSIVSRMRETGGIIECDWPSFRK